MPERCPPTASPRPPRISVYLGGAEHRITREEWREIVADASAQINALKEKCPTCRCRIYPGDTCGCCASTAADYILNEEERKP